MAEMLYSGKGNALRENTEPMEDPSKQLREYLEKLIFRFLYVKSLDRQLKIIKEWETPNRAEALNIGAYFFKLVIYSFARTILIELCKLVSEKEDKSLVDWLKKAKEHAASIDSTRHNPNYSETEREPIKPEEYVTIIEGQESQLAGQREVIDRIKTQRDKILAHSDAKYFNNPQEFYEQYPLSTEDIDGLMETVSDILSEQHLYLFQSDLLDMDISSASKVDVVLRFARAFSRARKDRELIGKGFRSVDYLYDPEERGLIDAGVSLKEEKGGSHEQGES